MSKEVRSWLSLEYFGTYQVPVQLFVWREADVASHSDLVAHVTLDEQAWARGVVGVRLCCGDAKLHGDDSVDLSKPGIREKRRVERLIAHMLESTIDEDRSTTRTNQLSRKQKTHVKLIVH